MVSLTWSEKSLSIVRKISHTRHLIASHHWNRLWSNEDFPKTNSDNVKSRIVTLLNSLWNIGIICLRQIWRLIAAYSKTGITFSSVLAGFSWWECFEFGKDPSRVLCSILEKSDKVECLYQGILLGTKLLRESFLHSPYMTSIST